MRTNKEWLAMLKKTYRDRAEVNIRQYRNENTKEVEEYLNDKELTFKQFLLGAFSWEKSNEGIIYWANIFANPSSYVLKRFQNQLNKSI